MPTSYGERRLHRRVYCRYGHILSYKTYITYLTTKRVWGNALTLALKFFTTISYNIWRVPRVRCAAVDLANFFSLSQTPYTVFTRSLYATQGERTYIIHINTFYRQIYHGRVLAVAGRRRGRRQGLRKQLHGLFARYVSYFERVAYFYCVTTMYLYYVPTYTRVIHAFGEFYIHFFYLLVTNRRRRCGLTVYVHTYVRYVLGGRPLLS